MMFVFRYIGIILVAVIIAGCGEDDAKTPLEVRSSAIDAKVLQEEFGVEAIVRKRPPLDLALTLVAGPSHGRSAIVLAVIDRSVYGRMQTGKEKTKPTVLVLETQDVTKRVRFEVTAKDGSSRNLNEWMALVRSPVPGKLLLDSKARYEWAYVVSAAGNLVEGETIRALIDYEGREVKSNRTNVPSPAKDQRQSSYRVARVALALRDADKALQVADQLIDEDTAKSGGYYFRAQALELKGDLRSALQAYEKALEIVAGQKKKQREPPVSLTRKIYELQQKLNKP